MNWGVMNKDRNLNGGMEESEEGGGGGGGASPSQPKSPMKKTVIISLRYDDVFSDFHN